MRGESVQHTTNEDVSPANGCSLRNVPRCCYVFVHPCSQPERSSVFSSHTGIAVLRPQTYLTLLQPTHVDYFWNAQASAFPMHAYMTAL